MNAVIDVYGRLPCGMEEFEDAIESALGHGGEVMGGRTIRVSRAA